MPPLPPLPPPPSGGSSYFYGMWQFGADLGQVIQQAIWLGPRQNNFNHLGATTALQNQRLADITNRAIQRVIDAMPGVGQDIETITLTAGVNSYAIPAAMRGINIERIVYSSALINNTWAMQEIPLVQQAQVANYGSYILNGTVNAQFPSSVSFDLSAVRLLFWPFPALTGPELLITYQVAAVEITADQIADRDSGLYSIGEVPTRFQNVLALGIAAEMVSSLDIGKAQELDQMFTNGLEEIQNSITRAQAFDRPIAQGFNGPLGPVNLSNEYGAFGFYLF